MKNTEVKVSDKYKTKNIITDVIKVFLAIANQTSTKKSSRRNLMLTARRVKKVCVFASFVWPFRNIKTVVHEITEKITRSNKSSL